MQICISVNTQTSSKSDYEGGKASLKKLEYARVAYVYLMGPLDIYILNTDSDGHSISLVSFMRRVGSAGTYMRQLPMHTRVGHTSSLGYHIAHAGTDTRCGKATCISQAGPLL